ncbi:MAG: hypothetical protein ACLTQF_12820 [Lachnospira sp.]
MSSKYFPSNETTSVITLDRKWNRRSCLRSSRQSRVHI